MSKSLPSALYRCTSKGALACHMALRSFTSSLYLKALRGSHKPYRSSMAYSVEEEAEEESLVLVYGKESSSHDLVPLDCWLMCVILIAATPRMRRVMPAKTQLRHDLIWLLDMPRVIWTGLCAGLAFVEDGMVLLASLHRLCSLSGVAEGDAVCGNRRMTLKTAVDRLCLLWLLLCKFFLTLEQQDAWLVDASFRSAVVIASLF